MNNSKINFDNKTITHGQREFKILDLDINTSKIRLKDTDELHGGKLCIHISVFFGDKSTEVFKDLVDKFPEYVTHS